MFRNKFEYSIPSILNRIDDEYRERNSYLNSNDLNINNIQRDMIVAEQNDLLYPFLKNIFDRTSLHSDRVSKTNVNENNKKLKLQKTISFIDSLFNDESFDYLYIKLDKGINYIPRDVDVLINRKQKNRIISTLKRKNINIKYYDDAEINITMNGLLNVDLYTGFFYFSRPFIDDEFLWGNPRKSEIFGNKINVPNYEADLLTLIIHGILGHRRLSLIDFLYAKKLLSDINLNYSDLEFQTKKHNWYYAYRIFTSILNDLYVQIYHQQQPINFPIQFSANFILETFHNSITHNITNNNKIIFIISTILDYVFNDYQMMQRRIPLTMSTTFEEVILKIIRKVKFMTGDRKGILE